MADCCCASDLYSLFGRKHFVNILGGYVNKALFKLGIDEYKEPFNWKVDSWKTSLEQMNVDAEIVFFGDSITRGGQWSTAFPEKKIVNLGISGDTIYGMIERVKMLAAVKPEKVFICGGINSLTDRNMPIVVEQYKNLLKEIYKTVPDVKVYVQSVLPISEAKEKECADNTMITRFNNELEILAEEYNATYVDVNSLYVLNGAMNPDLTKDGIHLKPEAYDRWYEMIRAHITE